MKCRFVLLTAAVVVWSLFIACKSKEVATPVNAPAANPTISFQTARALPDNGFKAEVSLVEPLPKLRTGQKETVSIKVKNASDVTWWPIGGETTDRKDNKYYIAAGNRWLDKDGKLTTEMEGHNAIPKPLKPGEETDMTLLVTAPKTPGEYIFNLDLVQEGVAWFEEKGSTTTKVKVTIVK
jgi:hypothetical protein